MDKNTQHEAKETAERVWLAGVEKSAQKRSRQSADDERIISFLGDIIPSFYLQGKRRLSDSQNHEYTYSASGVMSGGTTPEITFGKKEKWDNPNANPNSPITHKITKTWGFTFRQTMQDGWCFVGGKVTVSQYGQETISRDLIADDIIHTIQDISRNILPD